MVERLKEGYESDIPEAGEESDEYEPEDVANNDSDDDFRSSCRTENLKAIQTRLSTRSTRSKHGDSDSIPDEIIETKKKTKTTVVDENGDSITISDDEDGEIQFCLLYLNKFKIVFCFSTKTFKLYAEYIFL